MTIGQVSHCGRVCVCPAWLATTVAFASLLWSKMRLAESRTPAICCLSMSPSHGSPEALLRNRTADPQGPREIGLPADTPRPFLITDLETS
jgi:hypothetical protein